MRLYVTYQNIQSVPLYFVDIKMNSKCPQNNTLELFKYLYALFSAVRHLPGDPEAVNQF